jgi:hypothetical protein
MRPQSGQRSYEYLTLILQDVKKKTLAYALKTLTDFPRNSGMTTQFCTGTTRFLVGIGGRLSLEVPCAPASARGGEKFGTFDGALGRALHLTFSAARIVALPEVR